MKPAKTFARKFYLRWFFLFLSLFLLNPNAEANKTIEKFTEQNYRSLSGRVRAILEIRLQGLRACSVSTQKNLRERFNLIPAYSNKKPDVLNVLDLYLDSLRVEKSCRQSLDAAEMNFHKSERQKFATVYLATQFLCNENKSLINPNEKSSCISSIVQVIRELDPHCMSLQVPNPKEYYDGFPCLSGDNLIGKFLYNAKDPESLAVDIQNFINRFRRSLGNAEKRKNGIELYNDFLGPQKDSVAQRKKFLAVIALFTSSTSAYGSYIEAYHDHMWRMTLFNTQNSERALDLFNKMRITVDDFRTLREWSEEQKLKITVAAQNVYQINRHDYMAAFLACYYNDRSPVIQKWIPKALGYAYESFDFISHLRDGGTVADSKENFERDTRRYREGVVWGSLFCRLN